jgi:hypothetical protein
VYSRNGANKNAASCDAASLSLPCRNLRRHHVLHQFPGGAAVLLDLDMAHTARVLVTCLASRFVATVFVALLSLRLGELDVTCLAGAGHRDMILIVERLLLDQHPELGLGVERDDDGVVRRLGEHAVQRFKRIFEIDGFFSGDVVESDDGTVGVEAGFDDLHEMLTDECHPGFLHLCDGNPGVFLYCCADVHR